MFRNICVFNEIKLFKESHVFAVRPRFGFVSHGLYFYPLLKSISDTLVSSSRRRLSDTPVFGYFEIHSVIRKLRFLFWCVIEKA